MVWETLAENHSGSIPTIQADLWAIGIILVRWEWQTVRQYKEFCILSYQDRLIRMKYYTRIRDSVFFMYEWELDI